LTVLTPAVRLIAAVNALGIDAVTALERGEIDAPIYLLDQAGADFGYRYEWERFGPFSEALAADLVELTDEDIQIAEEPAERVRAAIARVLPLVDPVPGIKQFTWIRLLASLDFLQRFAGRPFGNGSRPAYIAANFEEPVIEAAIERLQDFTP
jgi:hypothetical protein